MTKVRILGPRARHLDVVRALQDLGLVHLAGPCADERLVRAALSSARLRELRHLESVLHDIDAFLGDSSRGEKPAPRPSVTPGSREMAVWARTARRARREMDRLKERAAALGEERALVMKYRATFAAVEDLLRSRARWPNATAYYVVLRPSREDTVGKLRRLLAAVLGEAFELRAQTLPTGEVVLLILVPAGSAGRIDHVLAEARVQEIPVPPGYGGGSFAEAIPKMRERYEAIPKELQENAREQERLLETHRDDFVGARSAIHDLLMEMEAVPQSSLTEHAFVMEGWLPADALGRLRAILSRACGDVVDVEELDEEEWAAESAPVVLKNPRLLRPFEVLIRMVPMPRYGTIDPTPFVAVFFPMFVGLMVGDVAYGLALAVLSLVVRARSREGSLARSISEIAGACAAFTVAFGFLYGELLGDLGKRAFGMRPLLMDRQEAVLPYLGLAVSIGLVHVLLGLGLGVVNTMRRKPRQAVGRGASFVMVILIVLALFGATGVLPRAFFAPSVVAILVTFVVLVAVEGLIAPIELLTTLGNVLSYARVMALGTASVMLSVVANRMVGRVGSVVVGVVLALLFHLVNFALGLFSPTIHALRLHYVEFFGKFYSPGGVRYRPFGHWSARIGATPERSRP